MNISDELAELIGKMKLLAAEADQIAREADKHRTHQALHRAGMVCRDFHTAVTHAVAELQR